MFVTLSDGDLRFCDMMGKARNDIKDQYSTPRFKSYGVTMEETNIHGFTGEYVVAKALNIFPDFTISLAGDGGKMDLVLPNGETIEVKYPRKRERAFSLSTAKLEDFRTNYGVLCWPTADIHVVEIMGYIFRSEFVIYRHGADYGYGDRLACEVEHFHPIDGLLYMRPIKPW